LDFWVSFFFVPQRIGIYVGWVDVKGFFDYASIEKVSPPFQGVNGKTDQINLPVLLVGWLLPDVHTVNDL